MSRLTREALLRELSAHPEPDAPLVVWLPMDLGLLCLLLFASAVCDQEPKALTPTDLMAYLARVKR